jgi:hypothetical protein
MFEPDELLSVASSVAPYHFLSTTKLLPIFLPYEHVVATIPMGPEDAPRAPSLSWRAASTATIAFTGFLVRAFVRLACTTEVHSLDGFVRLLDEREDADRRQRGLITGISILYYIVCGRYV